ncbi:class I mannose-6-phosphate isomerase [Actinomadura fulvescens]|uniref:Class I mannose-6-phosphate isomerase n=1 Tax=Actinomadura fulvescens TaxID=46160 RepID=A0ABN3PKB0_9ACTN
MSVDWYPLSLTTPMKGHVFGGRAIADRLRRSSAPRPGRIAETWEVSDVDGQVGEVTAGPLAGESLRSLVERHPEEMMGSGWSGDRFPILTKFIDASRSLPVHLHADDKDARALEGEPNGKTEAWHILEAALGATALVGVKPGVDDATLRDALVRGDFDAVMRRLPVRAGETLYVPAGTLHSFGPDTLVYEIEQTSDVQQSAMPWRMEDGSRLPDKEWEQNLDMLLAEWKPEPRPEFQPGLSLPVDHDGERVICCAGPYFALERWRAAAGATARCAFGTAVIVSNVGCAVQITVDGWQDVLGPGCSLLMPAALGELRVEGPADVLLGYLPDLVSDIHEPLAAAGYGPDVIAALGEPA